MASEEIEIICSEKLIEAVRSYTCLWQTNSKHYKDVKAKENSWKEIGKQVGNNFVGKVVVHKHLCQVTGKDDEQSRQECIRRWKLLRDRFVREFKKTKSYWHIRPSIYPQMGVV